MEKPNGQLAKQPLLPKGTGAFWVGLDNEFMNRAKEEAKLSNEKQQSVGAVAVCEGKVLAQAHNRNPLSSRFLINLHKKYCLRHILGTPTGKYYWLCPGCASKKEHAEYKISKELVKNNFAGRPVDFYLWGHWSCCDVCSAAMEKVPVRSIYFLENCGTLFDPKEPGNIIGRQFEEN